jgi:hypothetical protein
MKHETKRYLLIALVLVLVGAVVGAGCQSSPAQDIIITTPDYLVSGTITAPAAPDQQAALWEKDVFMQSEMPDWIKSSVDKLFPDADIIAFTTREFLIPEAPPGAFYALAPAKKWNQETGEYEPDVPGIIGQVGQGLGTIFPQYGAIIGLGTWLAGVFTTKRGRQHTGTIVKSLNPVNNGSIEVGKAVEAAASLVGWRHTANTAEEVLTVANNKATKEGKVIVVNGSGKAELRDAA